MVVKLEDECALTDCNKGVAHSIHAGCHTFHGTLLSVYIQRFDRYSPPLYNYFPVPSGLSASIFSVPLYTIWSQ